jgi:hypothetical protein
MKKDIYFGPFDGPGWPDVSKLEPYFLAEPGHEWSYFGGNDSWGLDIKGLYGTGAKPDIDRVNVHLYMFGNPNHGVMLAYRKWDGRIREVYTYNSKGDLNRLREHVETLHGTLLPVGLFIPFPIAWKAVKEFMERDGELPMSIEWIAGRDLPPNTFPVR